MEKLGERLKQLRIDKGVTQKQVADYLGVAPYSVQRFEYGTMYPSLENISKLCEYFNISADYLISVSNEDLQSLIKNNLHMRFYQLMSEKNISVEQLASHFDVSKSFIFTAIKLQRLGALETLIALANYFEVSLDWFVGRSETRERQP